MASELIVQDNLFMAEMDLFESDADVIVNAVNCVGVMGGGIARQFKQRFGKEYFEQYKAECSSGAMRVGSVSFWTDPSGKIICNFPTKHHYENPSKYHWIASGMVDLALRLDSPELGDVKSIALPALGCGLGNLDWNKVKHIIRMGSQLAPKVKWYICLQK